MNWLTELITNPFLLVSISSWLIAQVLKVIINAIVNKKLDMERLFGDGGMPSGHSATVCSLATVTGLSCGLGSQAFALSAILAVVVCHDAMGVRQETGKQAVLLNELTELFEHMTNQDLPEVKLKEFVGHTPMQVIIGAAIGIINALISYFLFIA